MGLYTLIEWAHHTINFWWGCAKVSPGCFKCYAEILARIYGRGRVSWGKTGARWLRHAKATLELLALDESARRRGVRERVFINSMSDVFEDRRDLDAARAAFFAAAEKCTNLDLLVLTKRIECVEQLMPRRWRHNWPAHVWLGFSAENQSAFDERWPYAEHLARQNFIAVIWASLEPLLEPVDVELALHGHGGDDEPELRTLSWVVVGGESGAGPRECSIEAVAAVVSQLRREEVPVFVKQLGGHAVTGNANLYDWPDETQFFAEGEGFAAARVKFKHYKGGDWNEWPEELRVREFPAMEGVAS